MPTVFKYVKALAPVNLLNGALWLEEEDISKIPESVFNLPEIQQAIADDELVEVNPNDLPHDVVSPTMKLRGEWDPSNNQLPNFRRVGDTYLVNATGEVNGLQLTPGMRVLFTSLNTFEIVGAGATATIDDWVLVSSAQTLPANGHYYWDLTTNYDLTLPATPQVGDFVEIYHILGDVAGYNPKPKILRNGTPIQGLGEDMEWNLNLYRVTFTYVDVTTGWIIYSAYLQVGNNDPVLPPRSGSVWLTGVEKQLAEPSGTKVLTLVSGIKADILELAGNSALVKVTAAVLPGSTTGDPVLYVYAVPGNFTPTPDVPFPPNLTPKVTATFTQVKTNLEGELDHFEFEADIQVLFSSNKAQIVLELASGGYSVVPYTFETVPQLISCDISSGYAANRTGFSAGSVVNLAFIATEPVDEITVWPHDAASTTLPFPFVPVTYPVASLTSGTISITIAAMNLSSSFDETGRLFVSATKYGQHTKVVTTTNTKFFDERFPQVGSATATVDPPGSQTSIKGTQDALVTVSNLSLSDYLTPNFAVDNRLQASPGNPVLPYAVTTGTCSFSVRRGSVGYNGRAQLPLTVTSASSGKSATVPAITTLVSVEDATFPDPVIEVNGGDTVVTTPLGIGVEVVITSAAAIMTPSGNVTIPGVTTSSWVTADNGHTWTTTGTVYDSSIRGTLTATATSLQTGAGTVVNDNNDISGTYKVSGFEVRPITITTRFSNTVSLGSVVVDGTLTVLDLALQPTPFSYTPNTITLLDPELYNSNATGTMPIYVSQGAAI